MRGVPVRIEVGPRELASNQAILARRDTGDKGPVALERAAEFASDLQDTIQKALLQKALAFREKNTHRVDKWEDFERLFRGEGGPGFVVAHWDGTTETEKEIANKTKATIRVIPLTPLRPDDALPGECILTGKPSKQRVVFAKAY
jgi:prolyl-tRNA synthetase